MAGVVSATRRAATRTGEPMRFFTLEDEQGTLEAMVFPKLFRALGDPVRHPGPWLVGGRVRDDHGDLSLVVSNVLPFHRRPRPYEDDAPAVTGAGQGGPGTP